MTSCLATDAAEGEPNSRVNKFLPGRTAGAEWGASSGLHPGGPKREGGGVNSAEQLCLACGLCCDGALFDNVRLVAGEDAAKLRALGLPVAVSRAKVPVARFPQPCAALCADRTCRVYADRPSQCRSFECGVFKDFAADRIDFAAALRLVKQARRQVNHVRRLLRELGDTEEQRSLNERFRRTKQRLEAGGAEADAADAFAELSLAAHRLHLLAHAKFYTKVEVA